MKVALIDVETTGFLKSMDSPLHAQPHIWEFAGILWDRETDQEKGPLHFRCTPPEPIPKKIEELCNVRNDDLLDLVSFKANLFLLESFFSWADVICAYPLHFDLRALAIEIARCGVHHTFPWPPHGICGLREARAFASELPSHRLRDMHYAISKGTPQDHSALGDTHMLLDIMRRICQKREPQLEPTI